MLFGMIDITKDSATELSKLWPFGPKTGPPDPNAAVRNLGSTRKSITRSNVRAVYISAILKKYFETFRDFGNIFPYMDELSNRLYKYIFTDKIERFLQDPDGKMSIPAFKIHQDTWSWFYREAYKRYGQDGNELQNMMKIFDEEFWNKLKPEVRENLSDLREQFERALAEQAVFAPREDEL